ncbi:MAG: type IX secretion system membrane protein PorP/SprF [Cyclobacteriaceae bacterium]|nr:type IX secretion system membrane protein PorP/SprF [Cyclobacteriaceae bacterium]
MKILLPVIIICLFITESFAQQDPLYAQYFNNPMLINPAVAGSNERLFVGLGYRKQWSGLDGSPTTFNFNSHMALANDKLGAGLIVVQDKFGEFKTTQYGAALSYKIKLTHSTFSFGMQAGVVQYSTNLEGLNVLNPDKLFAPFSEMKFNTGVGLLLKNERYTVGLSVPQLLKNSVSQGGTDIKVQGQNFYLYGDYLFFLSEDIEFKPSTLLRMTDGSPLSVDLNLNLTFNRLYTAGVFTRNANTYGVLVQMIMKNVRLGYVFELPGKSSALNFNTHEVSLALSLGVLKSHGAVVKF